MKNKHNEKYLLIGKAISEERRLKGLSQQELAEKIGVSKSYISKIEAPNCEKTFSLEILFDIAQALNIPVTQLFKYLKKE
ncbi:transcriptional regulator with XRE-family HTH domain [Geobacillus thermodenitrificans]|jgi:transcriptional regulator with XRE-family HTH domain|uniref:helix-turn-helix domain-containing protein n=1 Tax=Geobacillus thermodenitrificans TaxID=33940 RepID=UPI002DFFEC10|nr:transcriptional regulator with XRE-family HTH domain [Geobacillus thermodenitrificans]